MRWTKKAKEAMAEIVVETKADRDAWVDPKLAEQFTAEGLAVYMSAGAAVLEGGDIDATGNVAVRSTATGYEWYDANATPETPASDGNTAPETTPEPETNNEGNTNMNTPANTAPKFAIVTGLAAPKRTRTSNRTSQYPFADLPAPELNDDGTIKDGTLAGFFVPKTAEMPEPIKSISSAVSAANRKYSRVTDVKETTDAKGKVRKSYTREYDRKFTSAKGTDGDGNEGAWIYRIDSGKLPGGSA